MDLRDQLLRRRHDTRSIFAGLIVLALVVGAVYYVLQRAQGLPQSIIANRLLLFNLWYINIILILTILFILFRTLFRTLVDRRNRILGSKFKTKLVLTAIGLSLIPALILFPFATRLLLDSFDDWFNLPIDEVVKQAADTAEGLSRQIEDTNKRDARRVLEEVIDFDLRDLGELPGLQHRMQELREELLLDYLAIYDGTEPIHGTADPRAGINRDPKFRGLTRFLGEAIEKGEAVHVEDSLGIEGRLILAAGARERKPESPEPPAAEPRTGEPGSTEPQVTVVVAGTVLPPDLAEKSENLIRAYQNYLQLTAQREELRASYLLLLLMVTLLVILAFSSIGLRLASRITDPIQALVDGTRRISTGELDHRVEVAVDDELGVLVNAFNRMTGELQRNKELVDRSNRELLDTNKRTAAVLQNVAAGVVAIDGTSKIGTCNGAALRILHQREDEVIGKELDAAWPDPERSKLVTLIEQELEAGHEVSRQVRMTVGGLWKTLEVKVTNLPDPSGKPGGRVVVLEDLTELIYAQRMATWTEVARRIAHEIKNPLTPIKLTAERLLRKHQQQDPQLGKTIEEGVEVIVREVATMKSMVDQFSRYARMPRPQPQEIDLAEFVFETLHLYQGLKPGVEVAGRIDPAAATARFDPEQLRSALTNLLDNAIESTEPPGRVTISTAQRDGTVLLHVADTGRGIRPQDKGKIFLPYFSTKGRGTGLGLAIVQRIVTDNFANIRVDDNQPRGTIFTLEIPA
ncbi:MAG: HAMP domain-containing protein [bacterium]|nr:HAMP domain-containing protein [bacterium]